MWKKLLASVFIGTVLLSVGNVSHATGSHNIKTASSVDLTKYQVLNPEKEAFSTEDKLVFVNGRAPSGTEIKIKTFGTTDLTRKNFDLFRLPTTEDYIEVSSETIVAGNMGFFDKELELVTGINKILIDFGVEGVPNRIIIVYVKAPETNATREIKLINILQIFK